MKNNFILVIISLLLFSCGDQVETSIKLKDYFYPQKEEKTAYVYLDTLNPLDERVYVFYNELYNGQEAIYLERYARNLRLTEAYTFDTSDSMKVLEHMIIDRFNQKRKSELKVDQYLPFAPGGESYFNVSFPSHLDSVLTYYESKKTCINDDTLFNFNDKTYHAIIVRDSVKLSFYNPFNKKGSSQIYAQDLIYGRKLGLVAFSSPDRKIFYQLKKVLDQKEWELLFNL